MKHVIREERGRLVVAFRGELDLEHSPAAREVLLSCVRRGRDLLVDLSGIEYLDSSGVASLVEALQLSRREGRQFGLLCVSPRALRVLQLARLDKVFSIHDSIPEVSDGGERPR